jgi:glycosyltransferase involved in cell wall biosynthesis
LSSERPNGEEYSSLGSHISPICIVIPTYNRAAALDVCLKDLEKQSWTDFEVIVVDDGSTDSTPQQMEQYLRSDTLRLRYFRQKNSGPARARNLAISLTQSPVCLIIGDDIFATPDFIKTHLEFHQEHPTIQMAGLGLTKWSESGQTVTPFMRWLDEGGMQFSYHDLLAGVRPSWKHFYTSNISLKTEFLRKNPFNETFTKAAAEDLELGYRLEVQHGLEVIFLPQALAYHLHPTNFQQACRRMYGVGISMRQFHELWPEHKPIAKNSLLRTIKGTLLRNHWLVAPLIPLVSALTRVWCPNPLMHQLLAYHFAAGYRSEMQAD